MYILTLFNQPTNTLLVLSTFVCLLLNTNSQAQCPALNEADSLSLVDLYNLTDGANWNNNDGWLVAPVSTWFGITLTDDACNVEEINLTQSALVGNNLTGTLPELNLPELNYFNVKNNAINGTIPSFSGCPNLRVLFLGNNNFSGEINNFNLPNLLYFSAPNNMLMGSLPAFTYCTELSAIALQNNLLSGIIPEFTLNNLSSLSLGHNLLEGTVPAFDALPNLNTVHIDNNFFTFDGIETNSTLGLSTFEYAPQGLIPIYQSGTVFYINAGGNTSNNTYYWYQNDLLVATITASNAYIPSDISGNYNCVVTNSLATDLALNSVDITYTTPPSDCLIADSLALVNLYNATDGENWVRNDNWLQGPVFTWFGITLHSDGCSIARIELNSGAFIGNNLSGNLPDLNFDNLTVLDLGYNKLSSTIPNFDGMPNLTCLKLNNNEFEGFIPNFDAMPALKQLDLNYNFLTGNLFIFDNLNSLDSLALAGNQLTGTIPNSYTNMVALHLNNNLLEGSLPTLSNSPNLVRLSVQNNQLSNAVPNFGSFIYLEQLYIYNNQFTFEGMEINVAATIPTFIYAPQDSVLLFKTGNTLVVENIGGTVSNNTYTWYRNNEIAATYIGENTHIANQSGTYYCSITNTIAEQLTLVSQKKQVTFVASPYPNEQTDLINIYPTLCQHSIHITSPATSEPGSLQCYDVSGNKVIDTPLQANHHLLKVQNIEKGCYWLVINLKEQQYIQQIVKF